MAPIVTSLASIVKQFGIGAAPTPFSATGGTKSTIGSYTYHVFNASSTPGFQVTSLNGGSIDVLLVGAGGGANGDNGGGGGGGGVLYQTSVAGSGNTAYPSVVGSG